MCVAQQFRVGSRDSKQYCNYFFLFPFFRIFDAWIIADIKLSQCEWCALSFLIDSKKESFYASNPSDFGLRFWINDFLFSRPIRHNELYCLPKTFAGSNSTFIFLCFNAPLVIVPIQICVFRLPKPRAFLKKCSAFAVKWLRRRARGASSPLKWIK